MRKTADPTQQYREIVVTPVKVVAMCLEPSIAQVTARNMAGGELEISLSPNRGTWTFVPFNFPTTFRLTPGSVIWGRCVRPGGDLISVDMSVLVWPEPPNTLPASKPRARARR